ncbi:MAG: hypothetical protein KIS62_08120 [Ramlibacter sp.]|nr:hypothetical protein [Ramlibacter sp.]
MVMGRIYQAPAIVWNGPAKKKPQAQVPEQPPGYCSTFLPWPVYLTLQNRFPQRINESDKSWVARVKPLLEAERATLMPLSTQDFRDQLKAAVLNRGLRRINALKDAQEERLRQERNGQVISTNPYLQGATSPEAAGARFQDEMVQWLADMSDVSTPADGAIFWNGINENRLAERITDWNRSFAPGQICFGQLEATTDVRHVNNKYVWNHGNAYHKYGEKVSEMLGVGATGHVTAVVRWGLNKWSIFTNTELPRMLALMEGQILAGQTPRMTDLTIIVIEPLGLMDRVKCYVNADILQAPVWAKRDGLAGFPVTPDDCTKISELGPYVAADGVFNGKRVVPTSPQFMDYLSSRPRVPSPATPRLLRDIDAIIHANQPMTRV